MPIRNYAFVEDIQLENDRIKEEQEERQKEFKRQAGILGETIGDVSKAAASIANASFCNATFSQRIWTNQTVLKSELSKLLQKDMIQGKNLKVLAGDLRKVFDVSKYDSERLMRIRVGQF